MTYAILRTLGGGKNSDRFLGELPKFQWLRVGDYVIYTGRSGEERIGIVSVPDFNAQDPDAVVAEWGQPTRILAELTRHDVEWPGPEVDMDEPLPEIEGLAEETA